MDNVKHEIADQAYENFNQSRMAIEVMQTEIASIRKGEKELSDVPQKDQKRLKSRIARMSVPLKTALERINGVANFQDIHILNKIQSMSDSVCRILIRSNYGSTGKGTGCLIAPNLIMTNNHVFPNQDIAANSLVEFNYELDRNGQPVRSHTFEIRPDQFFMTSPYKKTSDPFSGLDFTIVAVEERARTGKSLSDYDFVRLDGGVGKIIDGESCVIIQHPRGDYKKIVLKDIRLLIAKEDVLIYESDTEPGSSGSIVVALGTGEVVALHHSGVPRKNMQGQWLRKDGKVAMPGDPDNMIDWIGNEGIRISRILQAVQKLPIASSMENLRNSIFSDGNSKIIIPSNSSGGSFSEQDDSRHTDNVPTPVDKAAISTTSGTKIFSSYPSFEIRLSSLVQMQEDWRENARQLVPGLITSEPLFPLSTDPERSRLYYMRVQTHEDPWEFAEKIELLPQVDECTPDLPTETDAIAGSNLPWSVEGESVFESLNDGVADWNRSDRDFRRDWASSKYVRDHIDARGDGESYRKWNRKAINIPDNLDLKDWGDSVGKKIKKISIVQLDTGYTNHSKVFEGFDLTRDEDFIDGEDARDEMAMGVLRHPAHGTRTASLIVGDRTEEKFQYDGNKGVLVDDQNRYLKVIPYRVSQSVVLIGRGKNVFDAAKEAINIDADILFMCMGSYPRPMLYEVAKAVYEKGIIWVSAAGNEVESVVAPAIYPGTIAVGAVNPFDKPWHGSSYGKTVDLCAPGEDVYVPFRDHKGDDIMVFGSGTSYATPQVAGIAALWLAKYKEYLLEEIEVKPYQIVEAFRACVRQSARKPKNWDEENYGSGILNVKEIMETDLIDLLGDYISENLNVSKASISRIRNDEDKSHVQKIKDLMDYLPNAYAHDKKAASWDLGVRNAIHFIWKTIVRKVTPGPESIVNESMLTERAKIAIAAMTGVQPTELLESYSPLAASKANEMMRMYFESYEAH